MPFCSNCGSQLANAGKFCSNCGSAVQVMVQDQAAAPEEKPTTPPAQHSLNKLEETEVSYYTGQGELIVKRTEHRGAGRKVMGIAAGLPTLGIGYLIVGKDKTRKSKAEGTIAVTNKAIYCAGNDYPFDRIISITKEGHISKSIVITFEKDFGAGGRAEGSNFGVGGMSIEIEIKTKDIDGLFKGLERAKMSKIKGVGFNG